MKTLILLLALSCVCTAAAAQSAPAPVGEVRISRPLVRIELPAERHNMWADQFDEIKGLYFLENGKTMELSSWGNRIYASIAGMPRKQMVAASPYVFVALDRKLKITIDDSQRIGGSTAEVLMAVPRRLSDIGEPDVTRLVATR
jgi:hypothetical protein